MKVLSDYLPYVAPLLMAVVTIMGVVQWFCWILGLGRFAAPASRREDSQSTLRYLTTTFLTRIITEFRHLLALVVVLVFAGSLGFGMYPGFSENDVDKMIKGIQAVAASLGGLLGSIIGYYFGESAARGDRTEDSASSGDPPSPMGPLPVEPILPPQPPVGNEEPS